MKGVVELSKLLIKLDQVKVPSYLKLIEETEQIHANMLKTLLNIQIKDIQDLFYILKPTQQLYNCVCGLLCFVAGVDKSITTDYLFLRQRDWVTSSSQFCKSYEQINAILSNLQSNLIKKKINISNIKEAQKYYQEELKFQVNSISDKLEKILTLSINYYTSFYKILKLNQKYEQQLRIPQEKSSEELKSYMLSKLNNFVDDDSEGKFEEETQIQNEQVQTTPLTPKDQSTPLKTFGRFKDFRSYQKGIADRQKTSKSPKLPYYSTTSKKQYYKSKSPLQNSNKPQQENNYLMNEYMSFQDQVTVNSFQTQPLEQLNSSRNNKNISNTQIKSIKNVNQKSSQSKSPVGRQREIQKKKEAQVPETPNLNKIIEQIQSNDPNIEKQLKQELELIQKQIKKLGATKKQLEWQDERQSKKIRDQHEQQYLSEQIEQSKQFLENRQQFKEEQKAKLKKEGKKEIKIKNEVQDFEQQRVWCLFKELERSIIEKEALQKDALQMEQQVCIKNQGIQKY
ncbi:unnamed protein product (macronuclear) [Paramecium tetraurelia]|uniref:Uncharacterized protein n=1 Tax=Paramecium tetraurelia TaxID=5888 RepID=A0D2E7_PARTE|nr:uncharacterized protein GSPATT00012721001 [Paramecium tetraurelia]CAK77214.1 unnamed protein product [Paramecium tetraurelia]|eukprot:XP_001444611.1 hypothetical protein (macronuclear) [Paramecium tetraurelia strain d4-2]